MTQPTTLYSFRFVLILLLQFLFGLGFSSYFLLPKYLTEVHHADATLIGRAMAAGPIAAVISAPLLARHVDQVRRHYLLLAAALAMLTASLGFSALNDVEPGVYVLRLLQGAAFTVYMSTSAALIIDVTPPERFGQALGLLGAANLATNALGPAIAEPLALERGWRAVFLLSAVSSGLAALGSTALHEPARRSARGLATTRLDDPHKLGLLYVCMVVGVAFGTIVTFYQPLALGIGITELRDLFIGYTLTALGVRILFGSWLDRFDRRRLASLALGAYSVVVFATAALQPGWLLPIGLGLGLAHGALYPLLSALFIDDADVHVRGALMTYFGGAFNVGMVLSTMTFGLLAARAGYRSVFILAGLLAGSAVPILLRAARRRDPRAA